MKRTVQMAKAGIPSAKGKQNKAPNYPSYTDMGDPIHLRPIYSIGKFYDKLNSKGKKDAKRLAGRAHIMPRIQIHLEIARIQRASKYSQML